MNVWNKVFYALIAVLCVVFTYFATGEYQKTKKNTADLEAQVAKIAQLQDEIAALKIALDGDPMKAAETWDELGLRVQLDRVDAMFRGDVFFNCAPLEALTFEVDKDPISQDSILGAKISFTVPETYGLGAFADAGADAFRQGSVAYVFDSGFTVVADDETLDETAEVAAVEPRYLGAFKFVGSAATQANLESVGLLTEEELTAIQESQRSGRSWIVCVDRLPMNAAAPDVAALIEADPTTFADLSEEVKTYFQTATPKAHISELFPEVCAPSQFVDYQSVLAAQQATRDAENLLKARRTLALNDLTYVLVDQLVMIGAEVDEATQALYTAEDFEAAIARQLVPSYEERRATLDAELAKMETYRDLAKSKLEEAQARVAECQAAVDATLAENVRLAAEIAQAQIALAENAKQKSENGEATTAFALSGI
ncbi:MAG: hypothetical protein IKW13_07150 [Thermoguttaceae bacterium]|nr:hypothetical protein [Thermoguttaceae bacterium]